jgi:hypothetical protein|tara:strand:- start:162 stop:995 length:834 start_codon:yes stop_codon:yes gene_type:complete
MYKLFYKLNLLLKRVIHYDKPLRIAFLAYLSLKFKTFKPHYESILYEACLEAKKLGINNVTTLELGVAGGNGIMALEKYKKKIEKVLDIKIDIYGFDTGTGLPETENVNEDLPFFWRSDQYKIDKDDLEKRISSKIFYGDVKDTVDDFVKVNKNKICCIFFDLDLYTSTKNFLNQVPKIKDQLLPRVLCYMDDVYVPENYINQFNGVFKAIDEFNNANDKFKLGCSVDHHKSFKFPLAKTSIYTLHSLENELYKKFISGGIESDLSVGSTQMRNILE